MDDLDCGRHAKSHHGSALPVAQFPHISHRPQSARVRFSC